MFSVADYKKSRIFAAQKKRLSFSSNARTLRRKSERFFLFYLFYIKNFRTFAPKFNNTDYDNDVQPAHPETKPRM